MPSRREVLKAGAAATAGMAGGVLPDAVIRAMAAGPTAGKLSDIQHVVFLIQENRSFDHYFGAYHGAHGFNEFVANPNAPGGHIWNQAWTNQDYIDSGATIAPPNPMQPFHLQFNAGAACTHDIDHQWITQHKSWNSGAMDKFVSRHLAFDQYTYSLPMNTGQKVPNGPLTMGYYNASTNRDGTGDLDFYYSLADHFTLCDNYHTSSISGSAANWIYALTGMIDPAGQHGGPVLSTPGTTNQQDYVTKYFGKMTWTTMMEVLQAAGISWKFYNSTDLSVPFLNDNFLNFFAKFFGPGADPTLALNAFGDQGWAGNNPASFRLACQTGSLPQVSWLVAPEIWSEHPPAPPIFGQDVVSNIVSALASNQDIWNHTALFITWDDSGGWFDHVPPITAPAGTPGEYLTCSDALLYDRLPADSSMPIPPEAHQPIGLGFRVPMLIISPWTRNTNPASGPLIASKETTGQVFDHTSMLRFLETLFCVEAPNLTAWRRETVGDLTSAFNFGAPDTSVPQLPSTALAATILLKPECATALSDTEGNHGLPFPYQVPSQNTAPTPERLAGAVKAPSGQVLASGCVAPANPRGTGPNSASGPVGGGGGLPNTAATAPVVAAVAGAAAISGVAGWATRRSRSRRSSAAVEAET